MLFAGQGIQRVFDSHLNNLKTDYQDSRRKVPRLDELISSLEATNQRLENAVVEFKRSRSEEWLINISGAPRLKLNGVYPERLLSLVREQFDNTFSTIAFQSGVICTFFNEIEDFSESDPEELSLVQIDIIFDEFIDNLNSFFVPKTFPRFKRFMSVLIGDVDESGEELRFKEKTPYTFRNCLLYTSDAADE